MKQQILSYERQIEGVLPKWHKLSDRQRRGWRRYHSEQLRAFRHERAIHLAVTLFFVGLTVLMLGVSAGLLFATDFFWEGLWPLLLATGLLTAVSVAYVAHYYFLENHIQKLYRHNFEIFLES